MALHRTAQQFHHVSESVVQTLPELWFRLGAMTTALGSWFQCPTSLWVKNLLLTPNLNLPIHRGCRGGVFWISLCLLPQFPVPSIPASLLSVCCHCHALSQLHSHHQLAAEGFPVSVEFKISPSWVWALLLSLSCSTLLAVPAAGSSPHFPPWTAPACELHPTHSCRTSTTEDTVQHLHRSRAS